MNNLKQLITLSFFTALVAACGNSSSENEVVQTIDTVYFTDANLESCVLSHAAQNNWTRVSDISFLACPSKDISDTRGLEFLENLKDLNLDDNKLTGIDIGNNRLLEVLSVQNNQLAMIDISSNSHLRLLNILQNPLSQATESYFASVNGTDTLSIYYDGMYPFTTENTVFIEILNTRSLKEGGSPLRDNPYAGVSFEINGKETVLFTEEPITTTYQAYVDSLNQLFIDQGYTGRGVYALEGLSATIGDQFSVIDPNDGETYSGNIIVISYKGSATLAPLGLTALGYLPVDESRHALMYRPTESQIARLHETGSP